MKIELSECPEILQETVKKYLSENYMSSGKIICVDKHDSTPYIDKSIVETWFRVIVQNFNYFISFTALIPDEFRYGVRKNGMNAGEILDIIKNAEGGFF